MGQCKVNEQQLLERRVENRSRGRCILFNALSLIAYDDKSLPPRGSQFTRLYARSSRAVVAYLRPPSASAPCRMMLKRRWPLVTNMIIGYLVRCIINWLILYPDHFHQVSNIVVVMLPCSCGNTMPQLSITRLRYHFNLTISMLLSSGVEPEKRKDCWMTLCATRTRYARYSSSLSLPGGLTNVTQAMELDASCPSVYETKHAVLRGAKRYDEAINVFESMLVMIEQSSDPQISRMYPLST